MRPLRNMNRQVTISLFGTIVSLQGPTGSTTGHLSTSTREDQDDQSRKIQRIQTIFVCSRFFFNIFKKSILSNIMSIAIKNCKTFRESAARFLTSGFSVSFR